MSIVTDIFKDGSYWILVALTSNTINYYENLGYTIPKYKNKNNRMTVLKGTKILIKVEHIPIKSGVKVTKVCDECGDKTEKQTIQAIMRHRAIDGLDRCFQCGSNKRGELKRRNVPFENSLQYKYPEIAKTWHPNKNGDLTPYKVYSNSNKNYWWICTKCDNEYETQPNARVIGRGCPYCSGLKVNITNCLWTTHPEIAKLLLNPNDGYIYNANSNKRTDFKCPNCEYVIRNRKIQSITNYKLSCPQCSDGISYPEKFIINLLDQLKVEYEIQKTFEWSKNAKDECMKLDGDKRYDFYIPSLNCIIEAHGEHHYKYTGRGRSLKNEQENDKLKENLAQNNGIQNYIIIDCRKSDLEWIKGNIENSKLFNLFDLKTVNWLKCHEYSCNTLVKNVCDLFNNNVSLVGIEEITKLHRSTITKYLKQGTKIGWCNYEPKRGRVKRNELYTTN